VNDSEFTINADGVVLRFAAGECRLKSARGSKRKSVGDWELEFRFVASANETGILIAPGTEEAPLLYEVASKRGWDYLWARYEIDLDNLSKRLIYKPTHANVDRVYDYADLNLLDL
jgi:hypothetical protein